jgi:hypothetical protein
MARMRANSSRYFGRTAKPADGLSASGSCRLRIAASQYEEGFIVAHKFSVGQAVVLVARVLQPAAAGEYEVRQLMPAGDRDPDDPSYRIKSIDEKHERVVAESDLTPVARADAAL